MAGGGPGEANLPQDEALARQQRCAGRHGWGVDVGRARGGVLGEDLEYWLRFSLSPQTASLSFS